MRLTKWKEYRTNKKLYKKSKEILISDLTWKLGQLEDIEDELGIDLIIFFKITKCKEIVELSGTLADGVFITHPDSCLSIDIHGKCVRDGKQKFLFKDYGKTWALTKEELE